MLACIDRLLRNIHSPLGRITNESNYTRKNSSKGSILSTYKRELLWQKGRQKVLDRP